MYGFGKYSQNCKKEVLCIGNLVFIAIIGSFVFDRIVLKVLNRLLIIIQNIGSGGVVYQILQFFAILTEHQNFLYTEFISFGSFCSLSCYYGI